MLHTKFRENRPAGSGEEDFWRVFTIYGHGGHLGHVTQMPRTKYCSPYPRRLHIKFGFDLPSGFGVEDVWNCLRRTDDGRTDGRRLDGYTISSPCEPNGSGELKNLLIWLSGPSIKRKASYTLLVTIRKRISLLQAIIEDITFGLVRMYVTPYRFSWTIFILGLALCYTDKLLVFRWVHIVLLS